MTRKLLPSLLLALTSGLVGAQDSYPSRAVKVIVPWPAGGSNDVAARIVMKAVSESMRQPFVIDNRAGAGGTIGADAVAKSTPDGYTIMVHSGTHIANAFTYKSLPYDTLTAFAPVGAIAAQSMALAVNHASKAQNVKELVEMFKKNPGEVTISSPGIGSQNHVQIAMLEQATGTKVLHVPYRGGSPQVTGLMSGETEAGVVSLSSIVSALKMGKIRLLAVTSSTRNDALPNVPTIVEEGVRGFDFTAWVGVFAPAGTPDPIVSRLSAELSKALARDDVKKAFALQAMEPLSMSPSEFNRFLAIDYAKTGRIIQTTSQKFTE